MPETQEAVSVFTVSVGSPKVLEMGTGIPFIKFDVTFYLRDEPLCTILGWKIMHGEVDPPAARAGRGWFKTTKIHNPRLLDIVLELAKNAWEGQPDVPASVWQTREKVVLDGINIPPSQRGGM
jgi:hypothetical protein